MNYLSKLLSFISRKVSNIIVRYKGVSLGKGVILHGSPTISLHSGSTIDIADRCVLTSDSRRTALGTRSEVILRTMASGARIEIGPDTGLSGTVICSLNSVKIGAGVLIGSDVVIFDTDFHPVDCAYRRHMPDGVRHPKNEIVIEDNVFIGTRAIICKGVTIGKNSVVGAGSVVVKDVEPNSVYAGNPARFIRFLNNGK